MLGLCCRGNTCVTSRRKSKRPASIQSTAAAKILMVVDLGTDRPPVRRVSRPSDPRNGFQEQSGHRYPASPRSADGLAHGRGRPVHRKATSNLSGYARARSSSHPAPRRRGFVAASHSASRQRQIEVEEIVGDNVAGPGGPCSERVRMPIVPPPNTSTRLPGSIRAWRWTACTPTASRLGEDTQLAGGRFTELVRDGRLRHAYSANEPSHAPAPRHLLVQTDVLATHPAQSARAARNQRMTVTPVARAKPCTSPPHSTTVPASSCPRMTGGFLRDASPEGVQVGPANACIRRLDQEIVRAKNRSGRSRGCRPCLSPPAPRLSFDLRTGRPNLQRPRTFVPSETAEPMRSTPPANHASPR